MYMRTVPPYLSSEGSGWFWWVIFAVSCHITTFYLFDGDILDVESNIVAR